MFQKSKCSVIGRLYIVLISMGSLMLDRRSHNEEGIG